MPVRTWMFLLSLPVLVVAGCVTRGNVELLEARLRERVDELSQLQSQLRETESKLAIARREAVDLRAQLNSNGQKTILPEQADVLYRATGIRINTLLTGGLDRDEIPGDDTLSVVLVPHDADGEVLKLPAQIEIEVLDLSKPQDQQRIGSWTFSVDESRPHWHRGLFGTGYLFNLKWQQIPESSELLLHARLTTTDNRQFDTSSLVRVTPAASSPIQPGEQSATD